MPAFQILEQREAGRVRRRRQLGGEGVFGHAALQPRRIPIDIGAAIATEPAQFRLDRRNERDLIRAEDVRAGARRLGRRDGDFLFLRGIDRFLRLQKLLLFGQSVGSRLGRLLFELRDLRLEFFGAIGRGWRDGFRARLLDGA